MCPGAVAGTGTPAPTVLLLHVQSSLSACLPEAQRLSLGMGEVKLGESAP